MRSFDISEMSLSMQLFMVRGAYGYKGFSEKTENNLYRSNFKAFQDTIKYAKEPIDKNKVSTLSTSQLEVLQRTSGGTRLIPLLNRMGQLGMMDLSIELMPSKANRSFTSVINAYQKSV